MSELEKKAIKQKSVLALAIALCKKGKSKTYAGAYALEVIDMQRRFDRVFAK